ncbi:MAG: lauroyl acyltransferase [Mariprofundales bacterium]
MSQNVLQITLHFLVRIIAFIPARLLGAIGAGLGRLAFLLIRKRRHVALDNLRLIYPQYTSKKHRQIARESFAELGRSVFEIPHVFTRSEQYLRQRVNISSNTMAILQAATEQDKGVILLACHHSNWEFGGLLFSMLGYDYNVIYRQMKNPVLEQKLLDWRQRFGACFYSRTAGLRWIPRALRQRGIIAVMIDQHMSDGEIADFIAHPSYSTPLPARLARKYSLPMIGVALMRCGHDFRFNLHIWRIDDAIIANVKTDQELMQATQDTFSPFIHERPELWLWMHRRWRVTS